MAFVQQQRASLFYLVFCLILAIVAANLRGQDDTLRERATNPTIRDDIRGKTLKELGVVASTTTTEQQQQQQQQQQQGRRNTQERLTFNYFSIYDEFGPFFVSMGDTAGCRGNIYNTQAREDGLLEEYVEGALQGTCSVVASNGKQFCSYEFFIVDESTGSMGTIVATGSVLMELNKSNILIIEATGDDFVEYNGGMITLSYTAISEQTVMDITVQLDRR